ncbi:DNA cytosine methyltransferase [Labilibaculum euxinus]
MTKNHSYIDLFSGCGGLSLGLHNAGWKGIFAIEKSIDAFKTLEYNLIKKKKHFDWPNWLDQKNHEINEVIARHSQELINLRGTVDMVAGGPPCQGFSMAGRRVETDSRNDLVNSYVKFIDLVRPKIIFFENVKGFTMGFKNNKKRGKAYSQHVVEELESLGYTVKGQLINFSEYGIPQKRTRFILVGIQNELILSKPEINKETFFENIKENRQAFLKESKLKANPTLEDAISDLLQSNGTVDSETPNFKAGIYGGVSSDYQKYARRNKKIDSKIDSHRYVKHTKPIVDRFKIALEKGLTSAEYRELFKLKKSSTKILVADKPTPTITTLPDDYIHYCEPRIMTVREYARIQSFPDWYEFKGKYTTGGIRRTQEVPRYSQIGNAIPPLFSEQAGLILTKILGHV